MVYWTIESELPVMMITSTHSRPMTLSLVSLSNSVKTHISCMQHFVLVSVDVSSLFMSL
jgi:hypothetical protein